MVTLYVAGQKVEWADAAKRFTEPAAEAAPIELRDDAAAVVARIKVQLTANDPDWVKVITPQEIARRMAEPSYPFEEVKKRLGRE